MLILSFTVCPCLSITDLKTILLIPIPQIHKYTFKPAMSTLYTISEQNLSMLPNNYTSPFSVKFAWARLRAQMPAPPRPTPCCPCPPVCSLAVQCGSVTRYTITELIYRCRIVYLLRSCCSTLLTVEDTAESTSAVACLYCERVESAPSLPRRALKTQQSLHQL